MPFAIRKAVFPVAGMGTRFLPATKANPKEMLPIVDKPLIQYAVEEAISAGITQMVFVTSSTKRAIEDHFDSNFELENLLASKGKTELLEIVRGVLPKGVSCAYVRQPEALGLGHAVWCAREVVGNEPFAVILADDLIDGGEHKSCLQQMVEQYQIHGCSVLGTERVPPEETNRYGIVRPEFISEHVAQIREIVEKPTPGKAPSNLAVVGRYLLTPRIFELLSATGRGTGGEIQLTDAIEKLLSEESVLAYQFQGRRYDCGNKLGFLQATVEYGLKHPDLRNDFLGYLRNLTHTDFVP
ncbi:UTP--glucose-1-phosphate uridylyltransferase [Gammaproteobacteria bacterium]